MSRYRCDDDWAEFEENSTCATHSLNRAVYPLDKSIVEADDMTCFLPDTWINSYVPILWKTQTLL